MGPDPQAFPLSGDIKYFRLPEVLQLLAMQRLTGRLTLTNTGGQVEIFVKDGLVAFASGDKRGSREQLGSMLVGMGRLTPAGLDLAANRCGQTGERLGKALVEAGLATAGDIAAALKKQTERSVYKAMAWGSGRFAFELCPMPGFADEMPAGLRVEDLILEGVRQIGEGRLIAEKIPSLDIVFVKRLYSADELDALGLDETERLVLENIDGKRDVAALIAACGIAEFTLMRALYAIYSAGIIKKRDPSGKTYRTQYL